MLINKNTNTHYVAKIHNTTGWVKKKKRRRRKKKKNPQSLDGGYTLRTKEILEK